MSNNKNKLKAYSLNTQIEVEASQHGLSVNQYVTQMMYRLKDLEKKNSDTTKEHINDVVEMVKNLANQQAQIQNQLSELGETFQLALANFNLTLSADEVSVLRVFMKSLIEQRLNS